MRELKVLAVVASFTLLVYYLVEPYAHHELHKKVDAAGNEVVLKSYGFTYDGTADILEANRKISDLTYNLKETKTKIATLNTELTDNGDANKTVLKESIASLEKAASEAPAKIEEANALLAKKKTFWSEVDNIAALQGNVAAGEAGFAMCMGCHMEGVGNMGGVIPPVLDHAGAIYDKNYLIALIKDPAMAGNVDHKYADTMMHPMGSVGSMFPDNQQIADVVAYMLKEKASDVTPKEAYAEACVRCHAVRFTNMTQLGDTPKFKHKKDQLAHEIKVIEEQELVKAYMGNLPPDLSMIIRARGDHFMETFIENPQGPLKGTSMPRVGLNQLGYDKVKEYLIESGDPSKKHREALGPWVLGFLVFFTILAYLWKRSMWKGLH